MRLFLANEGTDFEASSTTCFAVSASLGACAGRLMGSSRRVVIRQKILDMAVN